VGIAGLLTGIGACCRDPGPAYLMWSHTQEAAEEIASRWDDPAALEDQPARASQ